jgi:hypothetical protein
MKVHRGNTFDNVSSRDFAHDPRCLWNNVEAVSEVVDEKFRSMNKQSRNK